MSKPYFYLFLFSIFISACNSSPMNNETMELEVSKYVISGDKHFVDGYVPFFKNGDINAIIEIPAGTVQKWEVDKSDGDMKWEFVDGKPRRVNYLGYPANYGMIPGTLLSKASGGDGDPLDVIVLGPPIDKGSVVRCKLIGVLYLLDRGEKDDKLIAVSSGSSFFGIESMEDLDNNYNGITEIIRIWFTNYKGPGMMESSGYGDQAAAREILFSAVEAYKTE